MTSKQVQTIILQEEKIRALMKRNKALESGHNKICRINEILRKKIKKLECQENELNVVNT